MPSRQLKQAKPEPAKKKPFVLTTGLTQRLIHALDAEDARRQFVQMLTFSDRAAFAREFTPQPGEIITREATDEDLERFAPRRRKRMPEGQQKWNI